MEKGEVYIETPDFDYNDQHTFISCICGETVELFANLNVVCNSCGRMYWIESTVRVDWSLPFNADIFSESKLNREEFNG